MNGAGWITFAPIIPEIKAGYGASTFEANYMSLIYFALFIPLHFPSIYVIDKYGVKVSLIIGTLLTCCGAWIKVFINTSFTFALVG